MPGSVGWRGGGPGEFGAAVGTFVPDSSGARPRTQVGRTDPGLGVCVFEVRIHGRGGQGVVTAAELLSIAAFVEGRRAQAFPSFGSERTGAPVVAYCRIADAPIRRREPIVTPDAVIVQDPTLLRQPGVLDGLRPGGYVLVNTRRSVAELGLAPPDSEPPDGQPPDGHASDGEPPDGHAPRRVWTVPATELALEYLGKPLPNAVLLGGFAALSGLVSIESVAAAIGAKFAGRVAEANVAAARRAYQDVAAELKELADAQAG